MGFYVYPGIYLFFTVCIHLGALVLTFVFQIAFLQASVHNYLHLSIIKVQVVKGVTVTYRFLHYSTAKKCYLLPKQ
jgi:hypothetical protein